MHSHRRRAHSLAQRAYRRAPHTPYLLSARWLRIFGSTPPPSPHRCDVRLLVVGVPRQLDDLAPVQEWGGNGVESVGSTDEEDGREVERDIDVVILNRIIQ